MGTTKIEDLITYNPDTGEFKYIERARRRPFGWFQTAIVQKGKNYKQRTTLCIEGKTYAAHRLAWYLMKGYWPKYIDHINRDATDNRFSNLREVFSQAENLQNQKGKGAYLQKSGKYAASIRVNYQLIHLGTFNTEQEATDAYLEAKKKYHSYYHDAEV